MKKLFFLAAAFLTAPVVAQDEDLDEMFDDGLNKSRIALGTNVVMDAGGTINFYVTGKPTERVGLNAGIGFMPFGRTTDLMNLLGDERPVRDTALTSGLFYSLGGRLITETAMLPALSYYYYMNYRSWKYTAQEVFDLKRFKACFGIGYVLRLDYGFGIEANFGVFLGKETVTANALFDENSGPDNYNGYYMSEAGDLRSDFINGFDIGVGINYNF